MLHALRWIGCVLVTACGSASPAGEMPPGPAGHATSPGRDVLAKAPTRSGRPPVGAPSVRRVIDLDGESAPPPDPPAVPLAVDLAHVGGPLAAYPSHGELTRVLRGVLPAARACVPKGSLSIATLTFRSDGRLDQVELTGPAAGTPAASCIEQALGDAAVRPFADPSSVVTVPIRAGE